MPLYEYACPICAAVFSRLRPLSAAGEDTACPRCGAAAPRTLTAFAVHRRAETSEPPPRPAAPRPQLCKRYPYVPLVCHMEPRAAKRWIARAGGREEQYLEREARRQEAAARTGLPPPPEQPADHVHLVGHGHHISDVPTGNAAQQGGS